MPVFPLLMKPYFSRSLSLPFNLSYSAIRRVCPPEIVVSNSIAYGQGRSGASMKAMLSLIRKVPRASKRHHEFSPQKDGNDLSPFPTNIMIWPKSLISCLLFTHLASTLTLTQLSNSSSQPNELYDCIHAELPAHNRPQFTDCLRAIRTLPLSSNIGHFHTSGADDAYKLPVIKTMGTCKVTVWLISVVAGDEGTWRGVEWKAEVLNLACVDGASGWFGGYANAGVAGRIKITLIGTRVGGGDDVGGREVAMSKIGGVGVALIRG